MIDCRELDYVKHGTLPTAYHFDPAGLTDKNLVDNVFNTLGPLKNTMHLCVMGQGEGFGNSLLYHQQGETEVMDIIAHDQAQVNDMVMFLIKQGFPYVSVVKGGYTGIHHFLSTSSKFSLTDLSDHSSPKCLQCISDGIQGSEFGNEDEFRIQGQKMIASFTGAFRDGKSWLKKKKDESEPLQHTLGLGKNWIRRSSTSDSTESNPVSSTLSSLSLKMRPSTDTVASAKKMSSKFKTSFSSLRNEVSSIRTSSILDSSPFGLLSKYTDMHAFPKDIQNVRKNQRYPPKVLESIEHAIRFNVQKKKIVHDKEQLVARYILLYQGHLTIFDPNTEGNLWYIVKSHRHLSQIGRMTCFKKQTDQIAIYFSNTNPKISNENPNVYRTADRSAFIASIKDEMTKLANATASLGN